MDYQNVNNNSPFADAVKTEATAPATDPAAKVQEDLAKIELALSNLVAAGEDLFADEIAALKQKRDALLAKVAEEETTAAVAEVIKEVERTFVQKHGGALHTAEIVLLAAILARLFGVI